MDRGCERRVSTIGVELGDAPWLLDECWRSRAPGGFQFRVSGGAGTLESFVWWWM